MMRALIGAMAGLFLTGTAAADPMLSDFEYPWPVKRHALVSQSQALEMAYLDVTPDEANGETVVLLHGKNFCAATWETVMQALLHEGYRVVAPDQAAQRLPRRRRQLLPAHLLHTPTVAATTHSPSSPSTPSRRRHPQPTRAAPSTDPAHRPASTRVS